MDYQSQKTNPSEYWAVQMIRLIKLFATIVEKLSIRRPINWIISLDKYAHIYGNYQASHFSLICRSIIHHYIKVCIGSCKTSHGLFMNLFFYNLLHFLLPKSLSNRTLYRIAKKWPGNKSNRWTRSAVCILQVRYLFSPAPAMWMFSQVHNDIDKLFQEYFPHNWSA